MPASAPLASVARIVRFVAVTLMLLVAMATPAVAQNGDVPDGYAQLVVITNFDNAEVEINGTSYPYEWIHDDMNGVLLPSERFYRVVVRTSPEQSRSFRFTLENREVRLLVVDIENMGAAPSPQASTRPSRDDDDDEEEEEDEEEIGYLGVSSSPRGIVHVDGESTGMRTPARRIELEPGRHEVTVYYDEEETMSEVKHVLIRQGVNTNVFFRLSRERQNEDEDDE
jgi:hypothetical protein